MYAFVNSLNETEKGQLMDIKSDISSACKSGISLTHISV